MDIEQCKLNIDDRFLDPEALLEICTCLITFQEGDMPQVRLAHYTVQEYLVSERMKATFFKTSDVTAKVLAAKVSIIYLLNLDYERLPTVKEYEASDPSLYEYDSFETASQASLDSDLCSNEHAKGRARRSFPLIGIAMGGWAERARDFFSSTRSLEDDEYLTALIFKLLDPASSHFEGWIKSLGYYYDFAWEGYDAPIWKLFPGAEVIVTLGYLCYFGFTEAAKIFCKRNLNSNLHMLETQLELVNQADAGAGAVCGTPLHIAASTDQIEVAEFLIAKGANVNALSCAGWAVLNSALLAPGRSGFGVVRLLLGNNANPNPPDSALTPLQSSVLQRWCRFDLVDLLLHAKADVNGIGNDGAVVAAIRYETRNETDPSVVHKRILERGKGFYYDTPLRIVESRLNIISKGRSFEKFAGEKSLLNDIKDLLIRHGAVSLHIPPNDLDITRDLEVGLFTNE